MPWKDLFDPAIKIASEGFKATHTIISAVEKNAANVSNDPGLRWVRYTLVWPYITRPGIYAARASLFVKRVAIIYTPGLSQLDQILLKEKF